MPGLAHFLEHMLFTGTKKYPKEGCLREVKRTHFNLHDDVATSLAWEIMGVYSILMHYRKEIHLEPSFGGASEVSSFDAHGCSESESLAGEYSEFVKQNGGTTNATPSSTLRLGLASANI